MQIQQLQAIKAPLRQEQTSPFAHVNPYNETESPNVSTDLHSHANQDMLIKKKTKAVTEKHLYMSSCEVTKFQGSGILLFGPEVYPLL